MSLDILLTPSGFHVGDHVKIIQRTDKTTFLGIIRYNIFEPINTVTPNSYKTEHIYVAFYDQRAYGSWLKRGSPFMSIDESGIPQKYVVREITYEENTDIIEKMIVAKDNDTLFYLYEPEFKMEPGKINSMLIWRKAYDILPAYP